MRKFLLVVLIVVLLPFYLTAFVSTHEIGHVILQRLLGDPDASFYLYKQFEGGGWCLGCTSSDHEGFSWGASLAVGLGGLLATQTVALAALLLMPLSRGRRLPWVLATIGLTFAFFDILAQFSQGLYYNLDGKTYQTSVDLSDFMLLLQMRFDVSQYLLKSLLLIFAVFYLSGVIWLYRRNRRALMGEETSVPASPEPLQPPSGIA